MSDRRISFRASVFLGDCEWSKTPTLSLGHHVRFNAAGELVGLTIISPCHFLDRDKVEITLPKHVEVGEDSLGQALVAA